MPDGDTGGEAEPEPVEKTLGRRMTPAEPEVAAEDSATSKHRRSPTGADSGPGARPPEEEPTSSTTMEVEVAARRRP